MSESLCPHGQTNANNTSVISHTKEWLTSSVIGHNFCPYAKQPHVQNSIGYHVFTGDCPMQLLEEFALCCIQLMDSCPKQLETTLFIIDNTSSAFLAEFFDYLDVLDTANHFLEKPKPYARRFSEEFFNEHESKLPKTFIDDLQIASFHPQYIFADADSNDKENYTNRSPYPILHILRNSSIDNVRMNDEKAERIVENNCNRIQSMNDNEFKKLVAMAQVKP